MTYYCSVVPVERDKEANEEGEGDGHLEELVEDEGHDGLPALGDLALLMELVDAAGEEEVDDEVDAEEDVGGDLSGDGADAAGEEKGVEERHNIAGDELDRGDVLAGTATAENLEDVVEDLPDDRESEGEDGLVGGGDDCEEPPVAGVEESDEDGAEVDGEHGEHAAPEGGHGAPGGGKLEPAGHSLEWGEAD